MRSKEEHPSARTYPLRIGSFNNVERHRMKYAKATFEEAWRFNEGNKQLMDYGHMIKGDDVESKRQRDALTVKYLSTPGIGLIMSSADVRTFKNN